MVNQHYLLYMRYKTYFAVATTLEKRCRSHQTGIVIPKHCPHLAFLLSIDARTTHYSIRRILECELKHLEEVSTSLIQKHTFL